MLEPAPAGGVLLFIIRSEPLRHWYNGRWVGIAVGGSYSTVQASVALALSTSLPSAVS